MNPKPDLTFYAISAQVLPTLVIAIALGLRDLRVRPTWTMVFIAAGMNLALLSTGFCILALANGREPGGLEQSLVQVSIWLMIGSLVGLILRWFTHPDDRHAGRVPLDSSDSSAAVQGETARRRLSPIYMALGILAMFALRRR